MVLLPPVVCQVAVVISAPYFVRLSYHYFEEPAVSAIAELLVLAHVPRNCNASIRIELHSERRRLKFISREKLFLEL